MKFTGDKTDISALVKYAQALEAENERLRALVDLGEVIVCRGPPDCLLEDDAAVANQQAGCTMCKRIRINSDGSETEYQKQPN